MDVDAQQVDQKPNEAVDGNESGGEGNDLDDVFFPVVVVTKTIVLKDDVCNAGQSKEEFVDDNAILRCFDLSISSHLQKIPAVPRYEPIFSDNTEEAKAS